MTRISAPNRSISQLCEIIRSVTLNLRMELRDYAEQHGNKEILAEISEDEWMLTSAMVDLLRWEAHITGKDVWHLLEISLRSAKEVPK